MKIKATFTALVDLNPSVSTAYDFSTTGPGTFTISSVSRFQVAGLDGTVETNIADIHSITDSVSKRKHHLRSATVDCSKHELVPVLEDGLRESKLLAAIAGLYILITGADDKLYKLYFGSNDPTTVMGTYGAIIDGGPPTKLYCQTMLSQCPTTAPGYTNDKKGLYFCPVFFLGSTIDELCHGAGPEDTLIRGGAVVELLASAVIPDSDFIEEPCRESRKLFDGDKLKNPSNYRVRPLVVYLEFVR